MPILLSILSGHLFLTLKTIAMNMQKFIVSGIVGGIVSFFGGYLIYGKLMMSYFAAHPGTTANVMRADNELIWWALIGGSVCLGLMFSYIFNKWANITSLGAGAFGGLVIGFFMSAGQDLLIYGDSHLSSLHSLAADIICASILSALTGAAVGWMNGMGKKAA
jgi:hypothetical protein